MAVNKQRKIYVERGIPLHMKAPKQVIAGQSSSFAVSNSSASRGAQKMNSPRQMQMGISAGNYRQLSTPHEMPVPRQKTCGMNPPIPGHSTDYSNRNALFTASRSIPVDAKRIQAAKTFFKKAEGQRAVFDCAHDIEMRLHIHVCADSFYLYTPPIWRIASNNDVLRAIRAEYPDGEDLIGSLSNQNITQLLRLLKTSNEILISPEEFNSYPELLNFRDCVMNLDTGTLHEQQPEHLATTFIDVTRHELEFPYYRGTFEQVMKNAFGGDPNKEQLFLEIAGSIISNDFPKNFFVFAGESNTGKSKLGEFLVNLIGRDCCLNLDKGPSMLGDRYTLGNFPGKKLAFCFELPEIALDARAVAQVKQLTGDASLLSGEKKYANTISFRNTAKLLFCTNHRLTLSTEDSAFWKRLVLLPFENPIPIEKQDPYLLSKLEVEKGWLVQQALEAYRTLKARNFAFTKVNIPPEYQPEAALYSPSTQDIIRRFYKDRCIPDPESSISVADLYAAFAEFCRFSGWEACNRADFSKQLRACGNFESKKVLGGRARGLKGIALLSEKADSM